MRRAALLAVTILSLAGDSAAQSCLPPWFITHAASYSGTGCYGTGNPGIIRVPCLAGDTLSFSVNGFACESVEWQYSGGTGLGSQRTFPTPGSYTATGIVSSPYVTGPWAGYSVTVEIVAGFVMVTPDMVKEAGPSPVAAIVIRRSAPYDTTQTVDYSTADSSAKAGVHYLATSGTLTFEPGVSSKIVNVPIIQDTIFHPNSSFRFSLSNPSAGEIAGIRSRSLQIVDDDPPPEVGLSGSSSYNVTEGDTLHLVLTRTGQTGLAFRVRVGGPSTSIDVTFGENDVTRTCDLVLPDDTCFSGPEGTSVHLYDVTNGVVIAPGKGSVPVHLADNEPRPTLNFDDLAVVEGSGPYWHSIRMPGHLTGPLCRELPLLANLADGTAKAGSDYTKGDPLKVLAGVTDFFYSLPILEDKILEPDEELFLNVALDETRWWTNPLAGRLQAKCTILNDDTPPALLSIAPRASAAAPPGGEIHFTVTFDLPVHGVDRTDFEVIEEGVHGSSVTAVDGNGETYDVTLSAGVLVSAHGEASVALRMIDDDTIRDDGGNPVGGWGSGNSAASPAVVLQAASQVPTLTPALLILLAAVLAAAGTRMH